MEEVRPVRAPTHRGMATAFAAALAMLWCVTSTSMASAATNRSVQPSTGPGGSAQPHGDFTVVSGGSGADAWYLFEPTTPKPVSAPLAIITHGYAEYAGHESMQALIEHTVRRGNVVIYPRWQTSVAQPCPGPFDVEPCLAAEVSGIKGALGFLAKRRDHVQPQMEKTSYFGFSFGGIITVNVANRYKAFGLPRPRVLFLDDPHDGGLTGAFEPALDDDLKGIPASTLVECHSGAHGVLDDAYDGRGDPDQVGKPKADGSCNAVFPKLVTVPAANKSLVLTSEDRHGEPALTSDHGVCAGSERGPFKIDAYDWGFCWKTWDALRSCAYSGTLCRYALGDTPEHRYIGTWGDNTPIVGLKVQGATPIRAQPAPAREPAPARNLPPRAKVNRITSRLVAGTASDDDAVLRAAVAVVLRTPTGRCRELAGSGRLVALASCTRPTRYLAATGTRRWSVRLGERLPPGSYRVFARVTDSDGVISSARKSVRIASQAVAPSQRRAR